MPRRSALTVALAAITSTLLCATASAHPFPEPQDVRAMPVRQALEPPLEATPKADCGPGSRPETGLQGRVSSEDHASGRAAEGFTCNTELVGAYEKETNTGSVAGFKVERYTDAAGHDCAYYDTTLLFPTNLLDSTSGVNVLDMSDPANPKLTANLVTPAMQTPHESLVVSQQRGVLAAVAGNPAFNVGVVDVYDISKDCRQPELRATTPLGVFGHESGMAPDGRTFYSASPATQTIVALDISNLSSPVPLWVGNYDSHGLSISNDGNRAYVAGVDSGLIILDTTQVQARTPNPTVREIARLRWNSMSIPQNAIPVTIDDHPYVVEIDEFGTLSAVGAGRIIDTGDETNPHVVSNLRLEVHQPENFDTIRGDPAAGSGLQGYAGHYCSVPSRTDPGIVACSMILSGLRVFDIRDPENPREIAYYNAPVKPRSTPGFPASNWAMSSPSFVPERGEIWYSDGFQGFYAVRMTNGTWPFTAGDCNRLAGDTGRDRLRGTTGNDCIRGRAGKDRLVGGDGDDRLRGGLGRDALLGGKGNDTILAKRGSRDRINCGPGDDTAHVKQGKDRYRNCETIR